MQEIGEMNIAIVGSRWYAEYDTIKKYVLSKIDINDVDCIISGGANGVDRMAEKLAKELKIKTKIFFPDWKKYGKAAGLIRNKDIIESSDVVFAFWDGESRGTKSSIEIAEKMNKKLYIYKSINIPF